MSKSIENPWEMAYDPDHYSKEIPEQIIRNHYVGLLNGQQSSGPA